MFTGIVEDTGRVTAMEATGGDVRLRIQTAMSLADVQLGDSISTSGICLTVVEFGRDWYTVDVSRETLQRSTLKNWQIGQCVNVEKAMLPTTRFGGHIVSGHVDGVGTITTMRQEARSTYFEVTAPPQLAKYLAEKGSITVDGISLTINYLRGHILSLNLIPHTVQRTNIATWQLGTEVNLEVDILARYLERLLLGDRAADTASHDVINMQFLAEHGFLK